MKLNKSMLFLTILLGIASMAFSESTYISASKQKLIVDSAIESYNALGKLESDGLKDGYSSGLFSKFTELLSESNYSEVIIIMEGTNTSPELMQAIQDGLKSEKKPTEEDYETAIELKGKILDRSEFIHTLEKDIKGLVLKSKSSFFWGDISGDIDLAPLNESRELFDSYEYDKAWEALSRLTREIDLKSYQTAEKKKESLNVVLDSEKILKSIIDAGFDDKVATGLSEKEKEFFISRRFYSTTNQQDGIDNASLETANELLLKSNSSQIRPTNKDYEQLLSFKQKITGRKNKLEYIRGFIKNLEENFNKKIPQMDSREYSIKLDKSKALFLEGEYDLAFEEALLIEVDIEGKVIGDIIESRVKVSELNSKNFTTIYLSDLLSLIYLKFAPFQQDKLIMAYQDSNESEKLNLINDVLLPAKESARKKDESYKFIDFASINEKINEINHRVEQIYRLSKSISSLSMKLADYSAKGVDVELPKKKLDEAVLKFNGENYDDTESLLFEASTKLELAKVRLTVISVLAVEGLSFLQRNKYPIMIFAAVFSLVFFYGWINLRVNLIRRKIKALNSEKGVLEELIKKTQFEHFAKGEMPTSVYDIKYEKYTERMNAVKAAIPVQETLLERQLAFNRKAIGFLSKINLDKLKFIGKLKIGKDGIHIIWIKARHVLFVLSLAFILGGILYSLSLFDDSLTRYFLLIFFLSFFMAFSSMLTKNKISGPIVFLLASLMVFNSGLFDAEGIEAAYLLFLLSIIPLSLSLLINLATKKNNASIIISTILAFLSMPVITAFLISPRLASTSFYDLANLMLINLFISLMASLAALVVWHRARVSRFMLKMGY